MKLVEFSVTNYRSITAAHKIVLKNLTVLVGKNNEGKSNLLTALNVAMQAILYYSRFQEERPSHRIPITYDWCRDFPLQFQDRKNGLESIFKLIFRLDSNELTEFHAATKTRGNEDIPITVRIGKDHIPKIEVPKRGSSSYQTKSKQVTDFISRRIYFNYIQAIRTDNMAINALQRVINDELDHLKENEEYIAASKKVKELEQTVLDSLAEQLTAPLSVFLPTLKSVALHREGENNPNYIQGSRNIDVVIDDGVATSIRNKGDGIKSLVTLAILKERKPNIGGASLIAIEEPESHLHSGAIHSIVDVINKISENNQVIITTHNPLFVQQNVMAANVIVDQGTARPAKNIAEIRSVLGVLPSDNLRNARYVIVVEGEDDKIALTKILPAYSEVLKTALQLNQLVIKPLNGASNLAHDLLDLKTCMCKYVVLLDHDDAGKKAAAVAKEKGLLKESEVRFTICNGMPNAEFEDCLKPSVYEQTLLAEYGVVLKNPAFKSKDKWSDRLKNVFLSQGLEWNDKVEQKVKYFVANSIPERILKTNLQSIVIPQKATFLDGLVSITEAMLQSN